MSEKVLINLDFGGVATVTGLTAPSNPGDATSKTYVDTAISTAISGSGSGITTLTGDVTANGSGTVTATIANGSVTLAKQANLAANSIQGNNTGSAATPIALTPSQVLTLLGVTTVATSGLASDLSGTLSASQLPAFSGAVTTTAGSSATTLANNAVATANVADNAITYSKIQSQATGTILGNNTGSTGSPVALTSSQTKTLLGITATDVSGLATVATSGLASDLTGTLAATQLPAFTGAITTIAGTSSTTLAANAVTYDKIQTQATATILGNNTGSTGTPVALTAAQTKTLLGIAASDVSGLATVATSGLASDLSGTLAVARLPALTGDVTASAGTGATTITASSVTLAKMANLTASSFIGNVTGSSATPTALSSTNAWTILSVMPAANHPALTGAITTTAGSLTTTLATNAVATGNIAANAVTLAKLATQSDQTILGNVSGIAAVPTAMSAAQVYTMVKGQLSATDISTGTLPNARLVSVPLTALATQTANTFVANNTAGTTAPVAITVTQAKTLLSYAFSDISGTLTSAQMPAFSGDITTSAGATSATIGAGVVTYAKIQNINPGIILGRALGSGVGSIIELTSAQAKANLALTMSDISGLSALAGTGSGTSSYIYAGSAGATQPYAIAIGNQSLATASYGIAIGGSASVGATSYGNYSIAIGGNASAGQSGLASSYIGGISIGYSSNAPYSGDLAIGYGAGISSTAGNNVVIGKSASIGSGLSSTNALVIGSNSSAGSTGQNTIIGNSSSTGTNATGCIVIGASNTTAANYVNCIVIGNSLTLGSFSNTISIGAAAQAAYEVRLGTGSHNVVIPGTLTVGSTLIGASSLVSYGSYGAGSYKFASATDASANNSIAGGPNTTASGQSSLALGSNATASGTGSLAIGSTATAYGDYSFSSVNATAGTSGSGSTYTDQIAIGRQAKAPGQADIALGTYATITGLGGNNVAIGANSSIGSGNIACIALKSTVSASYATGVYGAVYGQYGISIGYNSSSGTNGSPTTYQYGIGIGYSARAPGNFDVALGFSAAISGTGGSNIAIGSGITVSGTSSIAIGTSSGASGTNSIAIGTSASTSTYTTSVAIGKNSVATANNQIVLGTATETVSIPGALNLAGTVISPSGLVTSGSGSGSYKTAGASDAVGASSINIGSNQTNGNGSVSLGTNNYSGFSSPATYTNQVTIGTGNYAGNSYDVAIGYQAYASNTTNASPASIAIGYQAQATGANNSGGHIVIGNQSSIGNYTSFNTIIGFGAYITGNSTTVNNYSMAIGYGAHVSAGYTTSVAIGKSAAATASNQIMLGTSSETVYHPGPAYFAGVATFNTPFISKGYTVSTLPSSPGQGARAHVTDATSPTFLGALTGGGSVVTPVFHNGTAWVAG